MTRDTRYGRQVKDFPDLYRKKIELRIEEIALDLANRVAFFADTSVFKSRELAYCIIFAARSIYGVKPELSPYPLKIFYRLKNLSQSEAGTVAMRIQYMFNNQKSFRFPRLQLFPVHVPPTANQQLNSSEENGSDSVSQRQFTNNPLSLTNGGKLSDSMTSIPDFGKLLNLKPHLQPQKQTYSKAININGDNKLKQKQNQPQLVPLSTHSGVGGMSTFGSSRSINMNYKTNAASNGEGGSIYSNNLGSSQTARHKKYASSSSYQDFGDYMSNKLSVSERKPKNDFLGTSQQSFGDHLSSSGKKIAPLRLANTQNDCFQNLEIPKSAPKMGGSFAGFNGQRHFLSAKKDVAQPEMLRQNSSYSNNEGGSTTIETRDSKINSAIITPFQEQNGFINKYRNEDNWGNFRSAKRHQPAFFKSSIDNIYGGKNGGFGDEQFNYKSSFNQAGGLRQTGQGNQRYGDPSTVNRDDKDEGVEAEKPRFFQSRVFKG